jgi:aldehyde dehydrogenase (NAD+)
VHDQVHDEVVQRVRKIADSLKLGPGMKDDTQMGPVVSRGQQERVLEYIEQGKEEGAKLVAGGSPPMEKELAMGAFVRPTVFDEVQGDMAIAREEIFGPVLSVLRFRDWAEAVKLANATSYGLQASVYTKDLSTALLTAKALNVGMVNINEGPATFPQTPFGGVKDSGVGREQGTQAAYGYTRIKNVTVRLG